MKLPRSQKQLDRLISEIREAAYQRGFDAGALAERKADDSEIKKIKDKANIATLNEVSNLARATGQAIEAMCRAMYDGRGM
jgi:hypothetical protein